MHLFSLNYNSMPHPSSHVIACSSFFPTSSIYASQFRHSTSFCPTPASFFSRFIFLLHSVLPTLLHPHPLYPPHAILVHSVPLHTRHTAFYFFHSAPLTTTYPLNVSSSHSCPLSLITCHVCLVH